MPTAEKKVAQKAVSMAPVKGDLRVASMVDKKALIWALMRALTSAEMSVMWRAVTRAVHSVAHWADSTVHLLAVKLGVWKFELRAAAKAENSAPHSVDMREQTKEQTKAVQ